MDIIVIVMIVLGLFFYFAGSVGVIRFPDFYSRLHPAGMMDSMGLLLVMLGLAIHVATGVATGDPKHIESNDILSAAKIVLIVVFVYITSPTATHAIVDAGVRAGLGPWTKKKSEESDGKRVD